MPGFDRLSTLLSIPAVIIREYPPRPERAIHLTDERSFHSRKCLRNRNHVVAQPVSPTFLLYTHVLALMKDISISRTHISNRDRSTDNVFRSSAPSSTKRAEVKDE